MKFLGYLLITSVFTFSCNTTPQEENIERSATDSEISHDEHDHSSDMELAKQLGADEYGMRKYVMAFLKAGPNRDQSQEEAQEMQKKHLENITRMADEGDLVLAGPFLDDGELRGIYIFNVGSVEDAIELTESDPMIRSGRLTMEMHPWYGSAAIMQVNDVHNRIQSVNISTH